MSIYCNIILSYGYSAEFCLVLFLTFARLILFGVRATVQSKDFFKQNMEYFWKGDSNRGQTFYRVFLTKLLVFYSSSVTLWSLMIFFYMISCVLISRLLYIFLFTPEKFLYLTIMLWSVWLLFQSISMIALFFMDEVPFEDFKGIYRVIFYVFFSILASASLMHVLFIVFINVRYFK